MRMSIPMFRFAPTLPLSPTVTLVFQSRELEKFSALKPNGLIETVASPLLAALPITGISLISPRSNPLLSACFRNFSRLSLTKFFHPGSSIPCLDVKPQPVL